MRLTHLMDAIQVSRDLEGEPSDGRVTSDFIFEIIILIDSLRSSLIPQTIKKLDLLDGTFYDALNIKEAHINTLL